MNRKDAERKRDKAIRLLKSYGMTDVEIAAELGCDDLNDETVQADPSIPVDSDGVIDVQFVELSDTAPMTEPPTHLPAVITEIVGTNQDSQMDSDDTQDYSRKSEEWWQERSPEVQARRCVAHKKTGERCKQVAIEGAKVCRWHGGAAKHVKAAARARLENATDLMAKQLLRMAIDDNVADAVKLSAIKDALDRGGLRAPSEVVLSPGQTTGFEEIFDGIYSGPRSGHASTNSVELQADSPFTVDSPPATAMPAGDASSALGYEHERPYTGPADRESHERPERRQSHRPSQQNGSAPITGYDAMRAANELRALPPGRE